MSMSMRVVAATAFLGVLASGAWAQQPTPTTVTHVMPNERCRMQSGSAHGYCGLPYELSNFQGRHECDDRVWIGRPTSVAEMQQMVAMADKAKGLGVGHSWYRELFCPANNASGIGIVTTELADLRVPIPVAAVSDGYSNPLGEGVAYAPEFPTSYPIWVDERAETVRVAAGVTQRTLLDYLSTYKGPSDLANGKGWTLPAFSWFIDQTIAGAVATGTHGSSLEHGSLSDQVLSFQVVVANGSLVEISHESHPHLMKAMKVNLGRLGIVTEMTMKIIPQTAVRRTLETLDWVGYVARMKQIQGDYVSALRTGRHANVKRALEPLWDTQIQYHAALGQVWWADYKRLDESEAQASAFDGPGATAQVTNIFNQDYFGGTPPSMFMATMQNARFWNNWFQGVIRGNFASGTFPQRRAYVSLSDGQNRMHAINPYDQYEVSIPLTTMGDCLEDLGHLMYGPYALWTGTRTPFLTRFVKGEDAYLSNNHGGPRMHMNLEDFVLYSTGRRNAAFQGIMNFFRTSDKCKARLHFGKAGWIEHGQCFDGATEYPDSWCDFGCAAHELDPTRKFESTVDFWQFTARRDGKDHDILTPRGHHACCTRHGFKHDKCQCVPRKPCSSA
ncbi:putative D-arabinono-1,4-lactone oxidase [Chloropicon primus]|uniref:Putative D-arabinono-1,4-lactone oxidase n=3 Tax=Chloropicon primus TaxID=1764295 RepID=A0A5B8MDY1_9CHLO|nr:putative D-arabinono-1,4-lactone oxidase [Chloropicon primus]UPQ97848.1 putative D-arabinono-1,4-lactone oxidase [Chloropicon primus]|eukprot:QDZ18639.1 putative D-arabinono-1,4-lactone oxidase [Chloropicon primus]